MVEFLFEIGKRKKRSVFVNFNTKKDFIGVFMLVSSFHSRLGNEYLPCVSKCCWIKRLHGKIKCHENSCFYF